MTDTPMKATPAAKHAATVVAWNLSTNHRLQEEPQAYKASLLRAGAFGMVAYCDEQAKVIAELRAKNERLQKRVDELEAYGFLGHDGYLA